MANSIATNLYLDNDDLIVVTLVRDTVNGSTGAVETAALSGATVLAYLATTSTTAATAIDASLSLTLTEVGVTGIYHGTMQGADKTTHLTATAEDTVIYLHTKVGSDYHESAGVILKKSRTAAAS